MTTETVALSTAWIHQPARGKAPARTLLVGAAMLTVRYHFGTLAFDLSTHSTTVTDSPSESMTWLAERLHVPPTRLLLWRAEDIVVPSLISACETERNTLTAARLLRELELTLDGEVIDVAECYGGRQATSFDAVSHDVACRSGRCRRTCCTRRIGPLATGLSARIWPRARSARGDCG